MFHDLISNPRIIYNSINSWFRSLFVARYVLFSKSNFVAKFLRVHITNRTRICLPPPTNNCVIYCCQNHLCRDSRQLLVCPATHVKYNENIWSRSAVGNNSRREIWPSLVVPPPRGVVSDAYLNYTLFVKRNWSIRFWKSLYFELPVGDESRWRCFVNFVKATWRLAVNLKFPTLVCRDVYPLPKRSSRV